jgi:uncharacterized protein
MSSLRSLLLCVFLLVAPIPWVFGQSLPVPPLTGPVIDQVGTLSAEARGELERELWALKREKGSEVVVLIVPSTQPEEIEQFSIRVVDTWKVGRQGVDDGALLLVALNDRRVRIEVGRGLEGDIPDVKAFRIIDELIVPRFRQGDVSGGILAGVKALDGLIRGVDLPPPGSGTNGPNGLYVFVTIFGFVGGVVVETILGLLLGAGVGGLITFLLAFFLLSTGWAIALGILVVVLVLMLHGVRPTTGSGGYGGNGRYGGRGGGWNTGGSFGAGSFGGGGSFSGGGSSGRW